MAAGSTTKNPKEPRVSSSSRAALASPTAALRGVWHGYRWQAGRNERQAAHPGTGGGKSQQARRAATNRADAALATAHVRVHPVRTGRGATVRHGSARHTDPTVTLRFYAKVMDRRDGEPERLRALVEADIETQKDRNGDEA